VLLFPPDGAVDVPVDAQVVVVGNELVEVLADGEPVPGELVRLVDRITFVPDAPFAPGAVVDVLASEERAVFTVGDRAAVPPGAVPAVDPVDVELVTARGAHAEWSFLARAEQPDAEPYGFFHVTYRDAAGEVAGVDAVWPADGAGGWQDRAPTGLYCAGIGYVDVAGHTSETAEACVDLLEPEPPSGCSTAGGGAWLAAVGLLIRARRR
jgi:hypothetical protein